MRRRPSPRALAGVAVLTAWAGTLAWLGVRTASRSEASTLSTEASLRLSPTAAWFAIYAGDEQVGSAGITLDTLSPGYRVLETVALELPMGPATDRATILTETRLGPTLALQDVRVRTSHNAAQGEWTLHPGKDSVAIGYGRDSVRFGTTVPLAGQVLTTGVLPYRLALTGGLVTGRTRQLVTFGALPPTARTTDLLVGRDSMVIFADSAHLDPAEGTFTVMHRDSTRASEVRIDSPQGPYRLWVDHRGAIAGLEWPLGVRWVRTDFDLAVQDFRRRIPGRRAVIRQAWGDLLPLAAPDTSTGERRFRIARRDGRPPLGGILALLTGGRQEVQTGVMRIHDASRGAGRGARPTLVDPLVQTDDPAIQRLAERLIVVPGREAVARVAAELPKLATIDTSRLGREDASGTLAAHRGRADGLVRLFVAILRAHGMEARYVNGVMPRGDTLFTHAWAEVWDTATFSWYAVDPVFGRATAGTSLIRLGFAGSSHPDDLRPIVGQGRFLPLDSAEAP